MKESLKPARLMLSAAGSEWPPISPMGLIRHPFDIACPTKMFTVLGLQAAYTDLITM